MSVISLSLTHFFVNETHEPMKENLITFPVADGNTLQSKWRLNELPATYTIAHGKEETQLRTVNNYRCLPKSGFVKARMNEALYMI